jgi:hypothetical protein
MRVGSRALLLGTFEALDEQNIMRFDVSVRIHDSVGKSEQEQLTISSSFLKNINHPQFHTIVLFSKLIKRQCFSMSRICNEKCSEPKIFLAFLSKLLCFSFIL